MSRARSRARKRAFAQLGWADQRKITSAAENTATRTSAVPKAKPQWVLDVESSGHQSIGGSRRSARATGLTRQQRQSNRADRKARPTHTNPHTDKVRQVRVDGRDELMNGTPSKLLKLPVGTLLRSSQLPAYRTEPRKPSLYTR